MPDPQPQGGDAQALAERLEAGCIYSPEPMFDNEPGHDDAATARLMNEAAAALRTKDARIAALERLQKVAANYIRCSTTPGTLSPYIPENGLYSYKSPWAELREEVERTRQALADATPGG